VERAANASPLAVRLHTDHGRDRPIPLPEQGVHGKTLAESINGGVSAWRVLLPRHAFATTLLVGGVHPKVVFEALRHSSVAFTMAVYSAGLPTMGEEVAATIETALTLSRIPGR
jgi:hypothetical protein